MKLLYGDDASDDLIWKVCDAAIKDAQASVANMRAVTNATSQREGEWGQLS